MRRVRPAPGRPGKLLAKAPMSDRAGATAGDPRNARAASDGVSAFGARLFARSVGHGDAARADLELQSTRAAVLFDAGRFIEARRAARRVASAGSGPQDPLLAGRIEFACGDFAAAEHWFRAAAAALPGSIEANAALAEALHAQERRAEALQAYGRALALDPGRYDCLIGSGACLLECGDAEAAESRFREAIAVDGDRAFGWRFLGIARDAMQHEADALAAHERAVHVETETGEDAGAYLALAASLRDAGRFDDALAVLESSLPHRGGAEARLLYGHMLLAVGRLPEGWHYSEFRWMIDHFLARRPRFDRPAWAGQELRGRTLLLRAEQGIGDTIQFVRYASMVKALGATVVLSVPPELLDLAPGFAGVDRVVSKWRDEAQSEFDYHLPLLSLPRVFGTDLRSIPADVPYLTADAERSARWAARLGHHDGVLRVGLVWGGNPVNAEDPFRSLPVRALAPLGRVPRVRYYALQKGPREHEADAPPAGLELVNLSPELRDFADTAAAITQLDLVISVCTSVAHLAGAMGKPVWVLLHRAADWRWLTERSDSPWYPTARLFRQTRRGDWEDVIARVASALADCSGKLERGRAPAPIVSPLPVSTLSSATPDRRAEASAVAEARYGIFEYLQDDGAEGVGIGWYGEWLEPHVERLRGAIRPGSTLVEVGAGIGAHALPLAAVLGPSGHLMLYEPRALQRRVLRRNLVANRVDAVTVMRSRLGARSQSGRQAHPTANANAEEAVETLDDLQLDRLDWIKVNEGIAPIDVLAGASACLWGLRPQLHVCAADTHALRSWWVMLRGFGYQCWHYETPVFNPENFNRRCQDRFAGRTVHALVAIPEEAQADGSVAGCVEWV